MNKNTKTMMKTITSSITLGHLNFLFPISLLFILCVACQKEPVTAIDPPPVGQVEDIEAILRSATTPQDPVPNETKDVTNFETEENGTRFSCTRTEVDATIAPEEFNNYDPNADVILAGMLLKGESLTKGTPDRVAVRRGPGNLSLSTLNGSQQVSKSMEEWTPGNYFETINDLLIENSGIVPARFNFTIQQIQTEEELEIALEAETSALRFIKASLSFSTDIEKKFNRIIVRLNQSYFNILFDRPNQISDFFHPSIGANDLQPHVGPLNPLTYISSVNVGRQFTLLIESTESASEIEAAANACFRGNCAGGNTKVLNELKDLRVKAFALGGDASQLIQAVTSDISQLTEFLASSGDIRTGVPLSYVVRTVLEDKVVKNGVTTKFTLENCVPIAPETCDCFTKGEDCEELKTVQKENTRSVRKGSGSIDASASTNLADEVVVGMKITVSNEFGIGNMRVRILRLVVRKVNPDGTLGPKRTITSSQGNGNGSAEIEFEAPGNRILTGIGLRVSGTNVNRARFHHAELFLDDGDCRLKLRNEQNFVIGDGGGLEQEYLLTEEYDFSKVTPCIRGVAVGADDDNINILKIDVGELVLK